jgi:hypothetical protein
MEIIAPLWGVEKESFRGVASEGGLGGKKNKC